MFDSSSKILIYTDLFQEIEVDLANDVSQNQCNPCETGKKREQLLFRELAERLNKELITLIHTLNHYDEIIKNEIQG